jgi:hypothetical protein
MLTGLRPHSSCDLLWQNTNSKLFYFDLHVVGGIKQLVLPPAMSLLGVNAMAHVCVFVNSISEARKRTSAMEELLSNALFCVYTLCTNGDNLSDWLPRLCPWD